MLGREVGRASLDQRHGGSRETRGGQARRQACEEGRGGFEEDGASQGRREKNRREENRREENHGEENHREKERREAASACSTSLDEKPKGRFE